MISKFVYSPKYDFKLWPITKLHPFDSEKFSKAWRMFSSQTQFNDASRIIEPKQLVSMERLQQIHDQTYLASLNKSKNVAQILEVGFASLLPNSLLQKAILNPMRLACEGTVLATKTALSESTIVMNFGGGFHHAFANKGEGFCVFADAMLSIVECRQSGLLQTSDKVLMIDLDAHRGNGFEALATSDPSIQLFDMYNFQVYPGLHPGEPDEFPFFIPLKAKMSGEQYLEILKKELPTFLSKHSDARLVFYNAGTDIVKGDPLGQLNVAVEHVIERDRYVVKAIHDLNLPTVTMTSGGYSKASYQLIAEMAKTLLDLTDD